MPIVLVLTLVLASLTTFAGRADTSSGLVHHHERSAS